MSWLDVIEKLLYHISLAYNQDRAEEWIEEYGKSKAQMFLEQPDDEEYDLLYCQIDDLMSKINKKSKGKFYQRFDWDLERDQNGKLVFYIYEN